MPTNFDPFGLTRCFIAGGAVLSAATKKPIADYDVYPKDAQGREDVIAHLIETNCFIVNISDRAITFKCNGHYDKDGNRTIIQVMILDLFPTAQEIFNLFDFTVCMAAYDCDLKEYIFHEDFYPDVASNTLRFNPNTKYPLASMIRVNKYRSKGYYISKFEDTKIALAIAKVGLPQSWDELESQIGGTYGKELKLQTDDMEFSYDNAIRLLSNLEFNITTEPNTTYDELKLDDILNCFITDEKQYVELNDTHNYFIEDGFFIGERFSKTLFNKLGKPKNFKLSKATTVFGYVASEGDYKLNGKNCHISIDKQNCKPYSRQEIYLVSVDISSIKHYGSYTTGTIAKVGNKVTKDTEQIDDVLTLLSEKICT